MLTFQEQLLKIKSCTWHIPLLCDFRMNDISRHRFLFCFCFHLWRKGFLHDIRHAHACFSGSKSLLRAGMCCHTHRHPHIISSTHSRFPFQWHKGLIKGYKGFLSLSLSLFRLTGGGTLTVPPLAWKHLALHIPHMCTIYMGNWWHRNALWNDNKPMTVSQCSAKKPKTLLQVNPFTTMVKFPLSAG